MIISFLMPFPIRGVAAPLLWIYYRQMRTLPPGDVTYVGPPELFADPASHAAAGRWELTDWAADSHNYRVPSADDVAATERHAIDPAIFGPLLDEVISLNRAWTRLLTEEYPPLVAELAAVFERAVARGPVEAALTWGNCPSLTAAASRFGVPVIHHELGALRAPHYRPTVALDFRGVNGNTEAADRCERFLSEVEAAGMPLLPRRELLARLGGSEPPAGEPAFQLGLALQVEDDSNLLAYSNGYSNAELIWTAYRFFRPDEVLIRPHPGGHLDYSRMGRGAAVLDASGSARDFIGRCRRVATINSSVGLEAALLGRPAAVLGDSPFRHFAAPRLDRLTAGPDPAEGALDAALNFSAYGYLVPEPLLFDLDYYRWRLAGPTELDIYRRHLGHAATA